MNDLGVDVAGGLGEAGAVDVGDEAEGQVAPAVMPQTISLAESLQYRRQDPGKPAKVLPCPGSTG